MAFFAKLLELWNVSGHKRLIQLKKDIREEFELLMTLKGHVEEKPEMVKKRLFVKIKRKNIELRRVLLRIIRKDEKDEKLQVRKLIREAIESHPADRKFILEHLQFLYLELKKIERLFVSWLELLEGEDKILQRIGGEIFNISDFKQLKDSVSEELKLVVDADKLLAEISDASNKKVLERYFGGETRYRCPKCKNRFVRYEKIQVQENPRLHQHTFDCFFCGHIEDCVDTNFSEIESKWI